MAILYDVLKPVQDGETQKEHVQNNGHEV
jgi:hypothetical protein